MKRGRWKREIQWKHVGYFLASASVLFGLWIVFSFSVGWQQLAVGVGCALLGGGFSVFVACQEPTPFRPSLGHLLQVWRLPWYAASDSASLSLALLRDLLGHRPHPLYRAVRFAAGREHSGRDTARRVLAIAYTSVTPNSVVVGIDIRRRLLLFHQIERSPVSRLLHNLGARE